MNRCPTPSRSPMPVDRCLALFLLLPLMSATAWSQRIIIEPRPEVTVVSPPGPVTLREVSIQADIREAVATVTARALFFNPNPRELEGTLLLPMPANARVHGFSMEVAGKRTEAELLDAEKAKRIYEEIVRRRRDPALLDEYGSQLLRARVFPIPANGTVAVEVRYNQELPSDSGLSRFETLGLRSAGVLERFDLLATIRSRLPIRNVFSPTHDVDVARPSDDTVKVSLEKSRFDPKGPVKIYYRLEDKDVSATVLAYRDRSDQPGTFLVHLSPRLQISADEIVPKDVVFVLDVSGSMAGEKMEQARRALGFCLKSINPKDRFAIIDFATAARTFESQLVERTPEAIDLALEHVKGLTSRGGTAIHEALLLALGFLKDARDDRLPVVLFLTDGLPTIGERDPDRILADVCQARAKPVRMFTFGVGDDVNTRLLDSLARENGGVSSYVAPGEDIEIAVSSLYDKIGAPVLTDISLVIEGVGAAEIYPRAFPALFRGVPLVALGRYERPGEARIRLEGKRAGKGVTLVWHERLPEKDRESSMLPRLWASRKVGFLLGEIRARGPNQELIDEVVRLAKEHGIVTPYTSYLITEDTPVSVTGAFRHLREEVERDRADGFAGGESREKAAAEGALRGDAPGALAPAGDLEVLAAEALSRAGRRGTVGERMRHLAGRTFYRRGNTWADARVNPEDESKAERIEFLSDRYMELVRSNPELAPILSLGSDVLFAHEGRTYRIAAEPPAPPQEP